MLAEVRLAIYNRRVTRASRLHQLQSLDLTIDRARARVEEIRRLLEDDHELAAARGQFETASKAARQQAEAVSAAEHAVASQQAKIREVEAKLYGGSLHNPKEMQDLQRDAESLRKFLDTLDERLLEAMLAQEEAEKEVSSARSNVERLEADRSSVLADLHAERDRLEAEMARHLLEREPAVADIPPDDLALYDRLRQSSGGVAVATVVDGACGVCGLVLSASGAQEVRSAGAPVRCRQCGRVLYAG
ncbi:MAG TPA: hypothetical protein VFI11_08695 [Anaerolineales bacterium]|nr:hypothetical protein [Anaerolineales bacterium]